VALIAVDGKPARAFRVGATVDGETVLRSVQQRGVTLAAGGAAAPLVLELPPLPPPATGVPVSAAAASPPAVPGTSVPPRPMPPAPPGAVPVTAPGTMPSPPSAAMQPLQDDEPDPPRAQGGESRR
jgi:general secretion pathway protein C